MYVRNERIFHTLVLLLSYKIDGGRDLLRLCGPPACYCLLKAFVLRIFIRFTCVYNQIRSHDCASLLPRYNTLLCCYSKLVQRACERIRAVSLPPLPPTLTPSLPFRMIAFKTWLTPRLAPSVKNMCSGLLPTRAQWRKIINLYQKTDDRFFIFIFLD